MAMTLNSEEQARVNNVYNEREKALAENNSMYEGLINQAGAIRDQQNEFLAQQEQIQNENLDKQLNYQTGLINQQKEEAAKNKAVEEKKALNDYTAYTNPYGLQNERLYGAGLGNSGVSETSKLGAYNAYQNRVAAGNAAYQKAIQQYDNDINQAILNNDVQKAENALNKLKLQLQNNQDYFSNYSSLSQAKLNTANNLRNTYMDQYNNVYSQIMNEQKQAEAIRQYNEQMAYQKERDRVSDEQWQKQYNLSVSKSSGSSGGSGSKSSSKSSSKSGSNSGSGKVATGGISDTTELYQTKSPLLAHYNGAESDYNWYKNNFEKHSYAFKDLKYVLEHAPISDEAKDRIWDSYGVQ